jgi:AraC-like DNA-binding protein
MTAAAGLAGCRIVRPPIFKGLVEVVGAFPSPRVFPSHVSETFGLCFKTGSDHDVVAEGRRVTFPASAVCVRTPGCVWSSASDDVGFLSLDIAAPLVPALARPAMRFLDRRALPDLSPLWRGGEGPDEALLQEQTLALLLTALGEQRVLSLEVGPDPTPSARLALRARDFLRAHADAAISLDELSRAVEANKFVLIRSFRRATGLTPHAYLVRLRVDRARMLLGQGLSAADAAAEAGFADQAHLTRQFKKLHGLTPAAYARAARKVVAGRSISFNPRARRAATMPAWSTRSRS